MPLVLGYLNPHFTVNFGDAAFGADQNVKGVTHLERLAAANGD